MLRPTLTICGHQSRGARGETLVESLVALLVAALGILMFTTAVSSSSRIVRTGEEAARRYYEANNALNELSDGATSSGKVVVTRTEPTGKTYEFTNIRYQTNDELSGVTVVAYREG